MPMQYHLPFEKKRINKLIDHAIIEAEKEGARVICLGALNKVCDYYNQCCFFKKKMLFFQQKIGKFGFSSVNLTSFLILSAGFFIKKSMTFGIGTTHRDLGHGRVHHSRKVLVCSLFLFSFGFRATKINFWKVKDIKK